ncbi:outer inflammatory protein OipA [Helicobacter pylori]|uniref:Outer inflammatory protein OipA n=1 Tax=Helicobacter pylori TaxID=210 RepID=A0AAE7DUG1_HELPX|nr:outer inflammatory protein OipA [Helicobacter pylori]QJW30080.1 outer inflammatory protein OipA [Helicobacter pylori A45]QJW41380.1 outer inflammatory protein OipA [Helicobacter pylori]QJW42835.1 outer inflammatory protein OipA [Helicobacter pylori]QJW44291.1 outer inflammatory protein OipA [Helicobacter pylori]
MLNHKENHEKSSLTLSLSFWLHAERNGFYLGLNFLEGSYIKGQGSIGKKASAENALNEAINNAKNSLFPEQNTKSIRDAQNALNAVKDSTKIANRFAGNGGSGGLFNELSFGYKYFLGKKRIIGFRHSLFFGYQLGGVGSVRGLIVFLPYGFNTDLLINWTNDKRASQKYVERRVKGLSIFYKDMTGRTLDANTLKKASRHIFRKSSGLVIGMDIGASTWFASNNLTPFNQVKSRTIFQLQGKFGVRWNNDEYDVDRYGDENYLGGSSVELGVKVPAFKVNYYSDNYGDKLDYKRVVSVYFNYTYNFKNKH